MNKIDEKKTKDRNRNIYQGYKINKILYCTMRAGTIYNTPVELFWVE